MNANDSPEFWPPVAGPGFAQDQSMAGAWPPGASSPWPNPLYPAPAGWPAPRAWSWPAAGTLPPGVQVPAAPPASADRARLVVQVVVYVTTLAFVGGALIAGTPLSLVLTTVGCATATSLAMASGVLPRFLQLPLRFQTA